MNKTRNVKDSSEDDVRASVDKISVTDGRRLSAATERAGAQDPHHTRRFRYTRGRDEWPATVTGCS